MCHVYLGTPAAPDVASKLDDVAKGFAAVLCQPPFISEAPSLMYISLAGGKATGDRKAELQARILSSPVLVAGGELPRGPFVDGWAQNKYSLIDANRSYYRVCTDEPGCCGEVCCVPPTHHLGI